MNLCARQDFPVAVDEATGKILGTGSVILEVGAYADLTGEFGRLAVLPEARNRGIGKLLMEERLRRVEERLQLGLIEGRTAHPYTLKIAEGHQFTPVGFLPLKWQLQNRESIVLLARHFGNALERRKNHPRLVPEAYPLACLALENCGVKPDTIVDEEAAAYPAESAYSMQAQMIPCGLVSPLSAASSLVSSSRSFSNPLSRATSATQ